MFLNFINQSLHSSSRLTIAIISFTLIVSPSQGNTYIGIFYVCLCSPAVIHFFLSVKFLVDYLNIDQNNLHNTFQVTEM